MSRVRIIPESEYKTTRWSGGTTTELFIWPEGSSYAERRFMARISTAAVEIDESTFTPLPGVKRFLTPLCAGFELTVNGRNVTLPYGEVLEFSGDDAVTCRGRGRDLNLMLKGADGLLKPFEGVFIVPENALCFAFAAETTAVSYREANGCGGLMLQKHSFARIEPGEYFTPGKVVLFFIFPE